jgi:multidrug efflux pump subunit AcrA (membrane-fusion protein)
MQREKERQRLMKEKYDAEARARKQERQAEMDRLEKQRQEDEEAVRLQAQREAAEAEAMHRQKEEQTAEQERGKRLQKAESQKVLQQREEEVRRAKLEEKERQIRLDEKARKTPSASPSTSPRRQEVGFGMFKRRRDDVLGIDVPMTQASPPQLTLDLDDREPDTIKPGGGGVVLNIDAPTSAVNAGDRVSTLQCMLAVNTNVC